MSNGSIFIVLGCVGGLAGLFKGNPNPPGDCGLDGLRIAGGIPAPAAIRLVTLCGGFSIHHFL
jgi:hypothetical protein